MNKLIVGVVQQSCTDNKAENMRKTAGMIADAAKRGAKLVLLQELHNTPYFCQCENTDYFDLAETIPGQSTEYFGEIARENGVVLVLSLFEKRAPGLYHNTAVVLESDGTIAGKYRKMHIPDDPQFYEKFYFTPGDLGFEPVSTSAGRLGLMVCWDQWYPEAARIMAMKGADMLLYPTAIGWTMNESNEENRRQFDAWITIQRAHAVANGLPVIVANRVGLEYNPAHSREGAGKANSFTSPGIQFWGNSFICGPQGEFLSIATNTGDDVVVAEIDPERTENVRRIWPFFRDRRIDSYETLLKRYGNP